ncbi:MAG: hypothetical protein ACI9T9_001286 [Oleiphilaceae bacterium]|jgi:hypothetical protein
MAGSKKDKADKDNKAEKPGALRSILNLISGQFPAYQSTEENERGGGNTVLEDSPLAGGSGGNGSGGQFNNYESDEGADTVNSDGVSDRDALKDRSLPNERALKYPLFQEMAKDPSLSEGLDMHLSYALSPDRRTNRTFELVATAPEHETLVAELNARLAPKINKNIAAWTKPACIFGTNFVRPYCEAGKGITHFQCDYWTLPTFVRKYEKAGLLAGYTSQHMKKDQTGGAIYLAPPWTLLEIKIPFYNPDINISPNIYDGKLYSLFDDVHHRSPVETQDYGTSLLEHCYEAYSDFKESLDSLRASRRNASRIDRFITTQLEGLDPIAGAEYINLLTAQLKSDMEHTEAQHRKSGTRPLINNSIIPVQGGSKGGVNIDTQSTDPNIQHIEDIMLHLRRMVSALGLDVSLLGWADGMSGGIGNGGFFQTSIQAARRATWIRQAASTFIDEAIELDFWYRHKKAVPEGVTKPWRISFYSLNSAMEEQENLSREQRANFASIVATLVDSVVQGSSNGSPTLKKTLLSGVLDIDKDTLEAILKELDEKPPEDDEGGLLSAFNDLTETEQAQMLLSRLMEQAE